MKTTIEMSDALFRRAKATAAGQGKTLKEFFAEAIQESLRRQTGGPAAKPWEEVFGGLKDLRRENQRIERLIAAEFEAIDQEEWR